MNKLQYTAPTRGPACGPARGLDLMPCLAQGSTCPLTWPFDSARVMYASGVSAGVIRRSLLAGGAFERALDALERSTLGPWARAV